MPHATSRRNRQDKKKRDERFYLDSFIEAHRFLAFDKITEREEPDFRVERLGRSIGVEVTCLYKKGGKDKSSEQQQSPLRKAVVKRAAELFRDVSEERIDVRIGFDVDRPVDDVNRVAAELASVIYDYVNNSGPYSLQHPRRSSGEVWWDRHSKAREVSFIYVSDSVRNDWIVSQVHTQTLLDPKRLKDIIDQKDAKAKYYEKFDELWLLIVVEFWDRAQDQQLPETVSAISSQFRRVFIFQTAFNRIIEVDLTGVHHARC